MTDFFRKNAILGAAEILCRIPLIFTAGYLARIVGTEAYGSWALIVIYQGFVAAISGLGMSNALIRFAPVSPPALARGYLLRALRSCSVMLCLLLALTWINKSGIIVVLGIAEAASWLLPLTVLLAFASTVEGLLNAYFKAMENIKRQIGFLLIRTGAEFAVVLIVFGHYAGYAKSNAFHLLAIYALIVVAIKTTGYAVLIWASGNPVCKPAHSEWGPFLKYGLPLVPVALISWFTLQGDRLILGHLAEKHWLGVYAFGAALASYLSYLGYAVYPLLLPRSSKLYDNDEAGGLQALFTESQYVLLALLAPVLAAIFLFAPEIVIYTAGPDFIAAGQVLIVLSISVAIEQVLGIYQYVFHLVKKTQWILWLNLCYGSLIAVVVYLAASLGELTLVPWAIVIATVGFNIARYGISRRFLKVQIQRPPVFTLGGVIIIAGALHWIASDWGILSRLLLVVAVTCGAGAWLNIRLVGRPVIALRALVAK